MLEVLSPLVQFVAEESVKLSASAVKITIYLRKNINLGVFHSYIVPYRETIEEQPKQTLNLALMY